MSHQISRRRAIAALTAATLTSPGVLSATARATPGTEDSWIDAHSHIWTTDVAHFPLREGVSVADLKPASFTDAELMEIAAPEGVRQVVLIQHHPYHGFDNSYLLDAVRRHPDRFRVVGMIDDRLPGVSEKMDSMLKQGVTGFRIGPREDHPRWHESEGLRMMWKTAARTRQSMCCLINPHEIRIVDQLCRSFPETPVVIDHFARIGMKGDVDEQDLSALCDLSAHPHVRVKISAYYALGAKKPPHHELVPMIRRLCDAFGAGRLMWASDCPYQLGDGNSYAASIRLIRDHIDFVSDAERQQLLRNTARETFFFA
ncbi:MAG: amidohydrolase family protein [Planctomycetaceae bacterium]|nr:amidohydrolase family protein [Planctomycetaceae bacterium]